MKLIKNILPLLGLAVLAASCDPKVDEIEFSKGNMDLSRYVAVGDYYTAGFNGGLTRESQQVSYPAIIAQQLAMVGGSSEFVQPLFEGNGTGYYIIRELPANGLPVVDRITNGLEIAQAIPFQNCGGYTDTGYVFNHYSGTLANVQNLGIPGLKVANLNTAGLGNAANATNPAQYNPYFERLLPAGNDRTYLDVAGATSPTFVTIWFGMSDIYNYLLSGGTGPDSCAGFITRNDFGSRMSLLLDTLMRNPNTKGIIATIPSFEYMGFAQNKALSIQQTLRNQHNNSNLTIWVYDADLQETREAEEEDILLLSALNKIGRSGAPGNLYGLSPQNPLVSADYLNNIEINRAKSLITFYNNEIRAFANSNKKFNTRLAVVSMDGLFANVSLGINSKGVLYNTTPITGGFYAPDGFSLTPRGHAIVANEFINEMNRTSGKFRAKVPLVNPNNYRGNQLP